MPGLHVGMADWTHPAGNSTSEAKEEMPEENGNILFSFYFVTTFFRRNKGGGQCRKFSEQAGKNIIYWFQNLRKKCTMETDLICLLASCPV